VESRHHISIAPTTREQKADLDEDFFLTTVMALYNMTPTPTMHPQRDTPGSWFRMPQEARLLIYKFTLETTPRLLVYEANHRPLSYSGKMARGFPFRRSILRRGQPVITALCKESRAAAYGLGFPGAFGTTHMWFFPNTDIVYFNLKKKWELFEKSVAKGRTIGPLNAVPQYNLDPRAHPEDVEVIHHLGVFFHDRGSYTMTGLWDNFVPMLDTLPSVDMLHCVFPHAQLDTWGPQGHEFDSEPWWTWGRKPTLRHIGLDHQTQLANVGVSIPVMGVTNLMRWRDIYETTLVYFRNHLGRDIALFGWTCERLGTAYVSPLHTHLLKHNWKKTKQAILDGIPKRAPPPAPVADDDEEEDDEGDNEENNDKNSDVDMDDEDDE
jgi:hypothetical protein